jgi:hypothetical protein
MTAPQIKDAWEVPLTTTFDLPAPVVKEGICRRLVPLGPPTSDCWLNFD